MLKFARAKPVGLLLLLYLSRAPALPAQVEKAGSLPAAAPAQTKPKKTEQPPAPELPVSAQAQQLSYDRVNEIVTLKGEVTVTNPPFTISGDEMEIYLKTNIVRALKNVRVVKTQNERQSEVILADFAELNMDTGAGYLIAGKMTLPTDTGSVTITGDKMEKINDNLYRFHQGSFTSCSCAEGQKPDWAMQAQEINADTNGTAKLKSVRVLIRGAKIMYLPYAEAPISDTRKSGFLTPEFGYSSRGGYQAGLPYFLVLGPSADLTIYPTYIQKRGFLAGTEFNHNLGPVSTGTLEAFAIEDQKLDRGRWIGSYTGATSWDSGYVREDINLASDNEYILDYQQDIASRWQRELDSDIIFSQNLPGSNLAADFAWADDLAGWDIAPIEGWRHDRDRQVIQQLPELSYQVFNRPLIGPLGFDLRAYLDNYWRENESLGAGVQTTLAPRLTFSPSLGPGVRFFSFAGYHVTALKPAPDFYPDASYSYRPSAGADFSLAVERLYGDTATAKTKYRHLLEPEVLVFYDGPAQTPEDPFFQQIFNPSERGLLGLNLTSLLFQKKAGKEDAPASVLNEVEITQFYDLIAEDWLDLQFRGYLQSPKHYGIDWTILYNLENEQWHRGHGEFWVEDPRQDRYWIGYVYALDPVATNWYASPQEPAESWTGGVSMVATPNLGVIYRLNYSALSQTLESQGLTFNYLARQKCWMLSVKVNQSQNPYNPERKPNYSGSVNFQILTGNQLAMGPEWRQLAGKTSTPPKTGQATPPGATDRP